MGQYNQDDMEGTIVNLKVTLLDHLTGNYREERLLQLIGSSGWGPLGRRDSTQETSCSVSKEEIGDQAVN